MNTVSSFSPEVFPILLIGLVQLAWYVAVPLLLYKIWRKVRHLPG